MDPLTIFLVGSAVAGSGLTIWGQVSAANAQEEAARKNAELKAVQAEELLARQAINEQIMRDKAEESGLLYGASFASTGREGAGVGGILRIRRDAEEAISLSRRDAEFKARMLRAGADVELSLASDAVSASWISGAGTLLTTGAQAYNTFRKPSSTPQSLPKVGT